ncbi:hypothetical protein FKM82_007496 [Ascaphus truei]
MRRCCRDSIKNSIKLLPLMFLLLLLKPYSCGLWRGPVVPCWKNAPYYLLSPAVHLRDWRPSWFSSGGRLGSRRSQMT